MNLEVEMTMEETLNLVLEEMRAGFARMDARFEQVDARFEQVDARFEQVGARFEQVDVELASLRASVRELDARLSTEIQSLNQLMGSEFNGVVLTVQRAIRPAHGIAARCGDIERTLKQHEQRLGRLETERE